MMEMLQKHDFVEIRFTGKTKDGEIFDSNIEEDLKSAKLNSKAKPFIFCLGEKMFLEKIDHFLIGKELGKTYEISLPPQDAFGERNASLVKVVPMRVFKENDMYPQQGATVNIDGMIAKIIAVSGGRVLADFNHPLAGKDVHYKILVQRKVIDLKEKTDALVEFFTKQHFEIVVDEGAKKATLTVPEGFDKFLDLFKDKFKEMLGIELTYTIKKPEQTPHVHEHEHDHNHAGHEHTHEH